MFVIEVIKGRKPEVFEWTDKASGQPRRRVSMPVRMHPFSASGVESDYLSESISVESEADAPSPGWYLPAPGSVSKQGYFIGCGDRALTGDALVPVSAGLARELKALNVTPGQEIVGIADAGASGKSA